MGIFKFKDYNISEKVGVAEASIFYTDPIFDKTWDNFIEFNQSSDKKLKENIKITYKELKPYIYDIMVYSLFPVAEINLHLLFQKSTESEFKKRYEYHFKTGQDLTFAVTGYASNFGHRNWAEYSKLTNPVKKIAEHGIIIDCGVSIDIRSDINFEDKKIEIIEDIKETIWHELNHLYEYYQRFRSESHKLISNRSPNISITVADENRWGIPKDIYNEWLYKFTYYIYASEPQEINAQVQEVSYFVIEKGFDYIYKTTAWKNADYMEKFNAEKFLNELEEFIKNHEKYSEFSKIYMERLKNMWVQRYEKSINSHNEKPLISLSTLKKMNCHQFVKYFEKRLNDSGIILKKKIGKLSYIDPKKN